MTDDEREQINRSDLEKINAAIDYLTADAIDLDAYQADPFADLDLDEALLKELVRVPITDADIEK
jgi:hypothetical protein